MADHTELVGRVYDAKAEGRAVLEEGRGIWHVQYAGNCERPLPMARSATRGAITAIMHVRCRTCPPCLKANMWRWLRSMESHILHTQEQGRRTWFGTLTLRPEAQQDTLRQAWGKWMAENATGSGVPEWWDDPRCDLRFAYHREVLVRELQLYWKRLRKTGARMSYIVVFERHKTGLPHMHFLLHEDGEQITKAALQRQWDLGFTQVKLVRADAARSAAYYVSKYLSKSKQSRQLASLRYDTYKYPLRVARRVGPPRVRKGQAAQPTNQSSHRRPRPAAGVIEPEARTSAKRKGRRR